MLLHYKLSKYLSAVVLMMMCSILLSKGCLASDRRQPFVLEEELSVHDSLPAVAAKDKHPKLTAIGLTVLLGPLGVHRLYLGTRPIVPVLYAITLGGGFGALPLIDLIAIVASKDLSVYQNRREVFMWFGKKSE